MKLSHDLASGRDITPCIKIDVIYLGTLCNDVDNNAA